MKVYETSLKYERLKDLTTEVLFHVASARARGFTIIKFDIPPKEDERLTERIIKFITRILRGMKKRADVQFFVTQDGYMHSTTEASLLLNIYPESEYFLQKAEETCVYVKI